MQRWIWQMPSWDKSIRLIYACGQIGGAGALGSGDLGDGPLEGCWVTAFFPPFCLGTG